ncbi:hypothetical protein [Fluviibacterium sp. S390]
MGVLARVAATDPVRRLRIFSAVQLRHGRRTPGGAAGVEGARVGVLTGPDLALLPVQLESRADLSARGRDAATDRDVSKGVLPAFHAFWPDGTWMR